MCDFVTQLRRENHHWLSWSLPLSLSLSVSLSSLSSSYVPKQSMPTRALCTGSRVIPRGDKPICTYVRCFCLHMCLRYDSKTHWCGEPEGTLSEHKFLRCWMHMIWKLMINHACDVWLWLFIELQKGDFSLHGNSVSLMKSEYIWQVV